MRRCSYKHKIKFFELNFSERSRQSARECRARKKLRYQYLEELVSDREKAVILLRSELEKVIKLLITFTNKTQTEYNKINYVVYNNNNNVSTLDT